MNDHEEEWEWDRIDTEPRIKSASSIPDPDPSEYKQVESGRVKETWETILATDTRLRDPLSEIDGILADNDYPMEAQIGGEGYLEVVNGNVDTPETLHLRIDQHPATLQRMIDNHFFQNMTETGKLYHVQDTPIAFEINDPFTESIPLDTDTDYLEVHAPTKQAFFDAHYSEAIQDNDAYDALTDSSQAGYGSDDRLSDF